MININEVRTGNILLMKVTDNWQIRPIKVNEFLALSERPDWAKPLEISEEILLKCGFMRMKGVFVKDYFTLIKSNNSFVFILFRKVLIVSSLHQLQNIYFSLTGQEINTSGL